LGRHTAVTDIQNQRGTRKIDIDKVGVKGIRYPIVVFDKVNGKQHTIASINMYVDLPHRFKGTHMSRFIEILNEYHREIGIRNFNAILDKMKERLSARSAHIEIEFPYFINKRAPVSDEQGLMEYHCHYVGYSGTKKEFIVGIKVPITTLCPCSKEIADFGAHSQRSYVRVLVLYKKFFWIEDIIAIVEECASADIYSLLKRSDEKWLTEHAYEHPMFVEDVVREVASRLMELGLFDWFIVESENIESIHNHSAYALIEWGSRPESLITA
jgi:GTP cyclohydrolase I